MCFSYKKEHTLKVPIEHRKRDIYTIKPIIVKFQLKVKHNNNLNMIYNHSKNSTRE